jgi:thioredoxin 1
MENQPIHVTDAEFEKQVMKSDLPVVVDFWAPWCGPCRMVAPTLDKIAKEKAGKLKIAKVNTDENGQWAMKFGVQGIPTMLFVANGKVIHQQVGALPEPMLRQLIDQFMSVVSKAAAAEKVN